MHIHAYDQALSTHIFLAGPAKFTSATPNARAAHHPVAHTQAGHTLAQGSYFASRLHAQNVGQLHPSPLLPSTGEHVQVIQAAGPHADQRFAWHWLWCRKILVAQHLRAATLVHHDRFQVIEPPKVANRQWQIENSPSQTATGSYHQRYASTIFSPVIRRMVGNKAGSNSPIRSGPS